jgi:hypothetical protein
MVRCMVQLMSSMPMLRVDRDEDGDGVRVVAPSLVCCPCWSVSVQPSLLALSSSPLLQGVTVLALAAAVLFDAVMLIHCSGSWSSAHDHRCQDPCDVLVPTWCDVHVAMCPGKGFCGGYDLTEFGQGTSTHPCQQEAAPYDNMEDYRFMRRCTDDFMSLFRCPKPTIAAVHGACVAGGSDIALCCDALVMADDATIGYMPARVWGCPTTAMWTYRLGPLRAKQLLFTGDVISGVMAATWGLANASVSASEPRGHR